MDVSDKSVWEKIQWDEFLYYGYYTGLWGSVFGGSVWEHFPMFSQSLFELVWKSIQRLFGMFLERFLCIMKPPNVKRRHQTILR